MGAGRRLVVLAILLLLAQPCLAEEDARESNFKLGSIHLELMAGYGVATRFVPDLPERQYAIASPRLGFPLSGSLGDGFYRGVPEILFQLNVQSQFAPNEKYAAGGCAIVRWNFLALSPVVVPYVDYGSGYMLTDYGLPEEGAKFGFEIEVGLGVHLFVADHVAISAETRFHHFSNAHLYSPNQGINSVIFLTGVSVFF